MSDESGPNSTCPRCGTPCRFRRIFAFAPPNPSHWDCPKCGRVPEGDASGRIIGHPRPSPGGSE